LVGEDPTPARPDPHKVIDEAMRQFREQAGAKGKGEDEV
jgi:hypothetical protein